MNWFQLTLQRSQLTLQPRGALAPNKRSREREREEKTQSIFIETSNSFLCVADEFNFNVHAPYPKAQPKANPLKRTRFDRRAAGTMASVADVARVHILMRMLRKLQIFF